MRLLCFVLLVCDLSALAGAEQPVYFPDAVLKEAVERALHAWDPTPTDMLGLTDLTRVGTFDTHDEGIADLSGIEYAMNLQTLNLRLNLVSDLSPLSGLTQLQHLDVSQNRVSDLSPLSSLTNLRYLNLHANRFADTSSLSALGRLEYLNLHTNGIDDVSCLAGMTVLQTLILRYNNVSDISPLAALTNVTEVDLCYNRIRDVFPLSGLSNLQQLHLEQNLIEDVSPLAGLTKLMVLCLGRTNIREIAPLLGLADLRRLNLENNGLLNREVYCSQLQLLFDNAPNIRLEYSPNHHAPTGLSASDGTDDDRVRLAWDEVCNGPCYTTYYRVLRAAANQTDARIPLSEWQTSLSFEDRTAEPGRTYTYWVRAAVSSDGLGAGDYSRPDSGWLSDDAMVPLEYSLFVSSTAGGAVTDPGEGTFLYRPGTSVRLSAEADPCCAFLRWSGDRTTSGNLLWMTVGGDCKIRAHFVSVLDAIFVDDDAAGDPGPVDSGVSDPRENGTAAHPFDSVQEAIEVAADGASIIVRPGVYREKIDLLGKSLQLVGSDPNDPNNGSSPVLDGSDEGPVVTCTGGEDPKCVLMGFVITRGQGDWAGAIYCVNSSPTIAHCLIVGNRATGARGAAIYCAHSEAAFINCTIADNVGGAQGGGVLARDSNLIMTNSILWGNLPCEMLLEGLSEPWITYTDMAGGWAGVGNLETDPLFAQRGFWAVAGDPNTAIGADDSRAVWVGGDYHVQSEAGRWDPQAQIWVQDEMTSPCLDAGDPASPVGAEPIPNGGLINLGVYGGTVHAGKSDLAP